MATGRGWVAVALLALSLAGCGGGGGSTTTNTPTAAAPTFSPAGGAYTATQSVTLADTTSGAAIHYTTDGTTPTASSATYSSAISVASTTTIKALAVASGYNNSTVTSATYTISPPATDAPVFTPAPGTYSDAQSVTLSDDTAGASIYYTTNGTAPTTASTLYTGAISFVTTTTIEAIAVAPGYSSSAVTTGTYIIPSTNPSVAVVLSTHDQTQLMATQPTLTFAPTSASAATNTIVVDSAQQYQAMDGFGAAFTDSAAYLLNEVATSSALSSTMNDLFTRSGSGIGLSFMRNPMGASDIARSVYSFDDQAVGSTDLTLASFSIQHDQGDILPIIKQAKALNPDMKILASPWSPPGWMKDPTSMTTVSMQGGTLLQSTANEQAFANYFVKYINAYQAAGVPIDYITLQNEPENEVTTYPSMGMTDTVQLSLLQNYVLPALSSAGLTTKVMVYDHNWDDATYPEYVLSGLTSGQLSQVAGVAWHGYSGTPGAQQTVQNLFPNQGAWMTEHSGGTWISDQFTSDFVEITQVVRNAAKGYVKWSLALDQNKGPNLTTSAGLGGCTTCTPIVTVNSGTGAVTKTIEYYTLGHYSKYVLPGAVRIYSSNTPQVASTAFLNPDGSTALIAFNSSNTSASFSVQWGAQAFSYTLPAQGAATFVWAGTQSGTPATAATAAIQGSSYSSQSGLQTETTSDSTGTYDLGYLTAGGYAVYKNVDFGTGVSQVSVRTASAGNGGTATFYLDSASGSPIATVNLPVTGGWQTWSTVTATASGATGVHDLYVVFGGGGSTDSIANINWFQFQ